MLDSVIRRVEAGSTPRDRARLQPGAPAGRGARTPSVGGITSHPVCFACERGGTFTHPQGGKDTFPTCKVELLNNAKHLHFEPASMTWRCCCTHALHEAPETPLAFSTGTHNQRVSILWAHRRWKDACRGASDGAVVRYAVGLHGGLPPQLPPQLPAANVRGPLPSLHHSQV